MLVDTDVVSFGFKGDTRSARYRRHLEGNRLFITFMTLAELYRWTFEHRWGTRRQAELARYLEAFTTIPSPDELCRAWGQSMADARRAGRPLAIGDAWQVAAARLYHLPLVTHNAGDYAGRTGLTILTA